MIGRHILTSGTFKALFRTYSCLNVVTVLYRPEKVRCGVDLVLHKGFAIGGRKALMRQTSHLTKACMSVLLLKAFAL